MTAYTKTGTGRSGGADQWFAPAGLRALRVGSLLAILSGLLGGCGASPPVALYEPILQFPLGLGGDALTVSWSGDGKYLAAGFISQEVHIWAMPGGQEVGKLTDFAGGIQQLAWSPHTPQLAVLANQPQDALRIWEPLTGRSIATLSAATLAGTLKWSPDGALLAVTTRGAVQLYDTTHWQLVHRLPYATDIAALAWSPDSHVLAVSREETLDTGYIDLWAATSGQQVQAIPWGDWPNSLTWSPDGQFLAAPGAGGAVQIWDLTHGRISATLTSAARAQDVEWAPDGQRLAVVDTDKIEIWAPATGALLTAIAYTHNATAGRWSPDNAYFAVAGLLGEVTVYRTK